MLTERAFGQSARMVRSLGELGIAVFRDEPGDVVAAVAAAWLALDRESWGRGSPRGCGRGLSRAPLRWRGVLGGGPFGRETALFGRLLFHNLFGGWLVLRWTLARFAPKFSDKRFQRVMNFDWQLTWLLFEVFAVAEASLITAEGRRRAMTPKCPPQRPACHGASGAFGGIGQPLRCGGAC